MRNANTRAVKCSKCITGGDFTWIQHPRKRQKSVSRELRNVLEINEISVSRQSKGWKKKWHRMAFYQINMSNMLCSHGFFVWMEAVVGSRNGCGKKNSSLTLKRLAKPTAYKAFNYILLSQSNWKHLPSKPLGCQSAPVVLPLAHNISATACHNSTAVSTYMRQEEIWHINSMAKRTESS